MYHSLLGAKRSASCDTRGKYSENQASRGLAEAAACSDRLAALPTPARGDAPWGVLVPCGGLGGPQLPLWPFNGGVLVGRGQCAQLMYAPPSAHPIDTVALALRPRSRV